MLPGCSVAGRGGDSLTYPTAQTHRYLKNGCDHDFDIDTCIFYVLGTLTFDVLTFALSAVMRQKLKAANFLCSPICIQAPTFHT